MVTMVILSVKHHAGLSPMWIYRHDTAMWGYCQAGLPPCGFTANGGEILPLERNQWE